MWLEYGIRKDKKRIHISQVPRGRTGLRCPYCDRYLIAKKDKIIRHHFAHDGITCNPLHRFSPKLTWSHSNISSNNADIKLSQKSLEIGMYQGYHYTYYHSILRGYLQKKDFRRAEKILIDLLPIIEKSCLQSRNIYVWDYYQMLASIYYRLQENFNEYLVIERYLNLMTMLKGMPHSEALQRWPQLQHLISQSPLVINTINQQNPLLMQSVPKMLQLPSSIAQRDAYPYSLKPTIINQGGSDIQSSIKWTPCLTIMMVFLGILICIACRLSFL